MVPILLDTFLPSPFPTLVPEVYITSGCTRVDGPAPAPASGSRAARRTEIGGDGACMTSSVLQERSLARGKSQPADSWESEARGSRTRDRLETVEKQKLPPTTGDRWIIASPFDTHRPTSARDINTNCTRHLEVKGEDLILSGAV